MLRSAARYAPAAIRHDFANELELSGSYRSDLRCASDWFARSSAGAHPHRIRMREARRPSIPAGYRKRSHLGKPHARRTPCRQTEHKSRALLSSASRSGFVCVKNDRLRSRRVGIPNWHKKARSPLRRPKALTLFEQPRSCGMSNSIHWRFLRSAFLRQQSPGIS